MQWLLQNSRQMEKKQDTEKRADELMKILLQNNRDCVLVSHGFFMGTLLKKMKQYGFVIDKEKVGFANLEKVIAVK